MTKASSIEQKYCDQLLRAQSSRNRFSFRRDYATSGIMTKLEALFIQDLINKVTMPKTKKIEHKIGDGVVRIFFLCTVGYLQRSLAWDKVSQNRFLKSLEEKGFVQVKRLGEKGRRHVWINIKAIEDAVDQAKSEKKHHTFQQITTNAVIRKNIDVPDVTKVSYPDNLKFSPNKEDTNVSSLKDRRRKENASSPNMPSSVEISSNGFGIPETELTSLQKECIGHLKSSVKEVNGSVQGWNKKVDMKITTLIPRIAKRFGITEEEVVESARFYATNAKQRKEKKLPDIINVGRFFSKKVFEWILDRKRRDGASSSSVIISEEALSIAKRFQQSQWPKGSKEQLPQAIQVSLNNYRQFKEARKRLFETTKITRVKDCLEYIDGLFLSPPAFVENWFVAEYERIVDWPEWSGRLQVVQIDNARFQGIVREIVADFTDSPAMWESFSQEIKAVLS